MKSIIIKCNKTAKKQEHNLQDGIWGRVVEEWFEAIKFHSKLQKLGSSNFSEAQLVRVLVLGLGLQIFHQTWSLFSFSNPSIFYKTLPRHIISLSLCYSLQLIILKKTRNWERNNNHKQRSQTNIDSLRKYKMSQPTTKPRDLTTKPFLIQLSLYFLSRHLSIYLHFWNDCFYLILKCACGEIILK